VQNSHVALLVALATGDDVPAAHGVHEVAPVDDQEPAAQTWHVALLVALVTGDHVPAAQGVHELAATDDQEPAAHCVHDVIPELAAR